MNNKLVSFIQDIYQTKDFIPLHAPTFSGNERNNVLSTIESTFVSSVGKFVDDFEIKIQNFTESPKAVAVMNGTAALHAALYLIGTQRNDLIITQALTFIATCNAIYHLGAHPIFIDVSKVSLGLCPKALERYLEENAQVLDNGQCVHKSTKQTIRAVLPMHTFGHPVELNEIISVCKKWNLALIEDAAESLGSLYKNKHTGTFGEFGVLSFNGNKIITTGGGGMILCKSEENGKRAKHITTTSKVPHPYEFFHDEPGFNYRMPNLNAALGCAQMDNLPLFLEQKRILAKAYQDFFKASEYIFVTEPEYAHSNYWLNAIICPDKAARDHILQGTNEQGVMTRPIWQLMHRLPMFKDALRGELPISEWIEQHLVNLPSTPVDL